MTTYNIQIEVPDDVPADDVHEDLCLVLHEGAEPTISYIDIKLFNLRPTCYLQGPNGEESTLQVTSPDPVDGTFCAHLPSNQNELSEDWWIRIVLN